jgi:hypothetical protein
MAKQLTYNEATALWYERHPDLKALRGSWQAITCSTCGYLDETMEPAWWACPQCLKLVQQPNHLRPVVSISCEVVENEAIAPGTPPSAIRPNPQPPAPEPVTAPTAPILDQPKPPGISCRIVTTKRK